MVISKNKFASSFYHSDKKTIVSVYKGRVNYDLAVEQAETLLDFYRNNEVEASLIDVSKMYGSFVKLMDYYKEGFPIAVQSGLKRVAYVVSDDIITANQITKMELMASKFNVETRIFKTQQLAKDWLGIGIN